MNQPVTQMLIALIKGVTTCIRVFTSVELQSLCYHICLNVQVGLPPLSTWLKIVLDQFVSHHT